MEEQHATPEDASPQQQCIFCHIASGRVASRKIYEDDKVVCVLDINPANPGHALILPREHAVIMPQLPEDVLRHMAMVARAISHAQLRALKAQGTNIFVANGVASGQRAQHFMLHVIPRMDGDQISFALPERTMAPADAKKVQQMLRKALGKLLNFTAEEEPAPKEEPAEEKPAPKKEPPQEKEAKPKKETPKKPSKGANLDEIARLLTGGK
jgi:histidine triad (HIT) family protein